ncbi:hypothetical protein ACFWP0_13355 [Achromobacter sp. NPDC058515]|uniref:hypothetical protein n=1 Tax=Achromobacter sp. NPDC058515 TaxID=3346533 RepID=UPI00364BD447
MKRCNAGLAWAVAIAGVAVGAGVALRGRPDWPEAGGQAWAAWVQAIGSVAAICVAIWVAHDQHAKAERRHREIQDGEVRNFLAGLRVELDVLWSEYMVQVGDDLNSTPKGQIAYMRWPAPEQPFKVYGATVGLIGRVGDDSLRKSIIMTYAVAGGLMQTWQTHNRMLEEFVEAKKNTSREEAASSQAISGRRASLVAYGEKLRAHQDNASRLIGATIKAIDAHLSAGGA